MRLNFKIDFVFYIIYNYTMLTQVSYNDLFSNQDLSSKIEDAFGDNGLGAIIVTDIPNFKNEKIKLLKLSKVFGELPTEVQEKYENPETYYSFGWSRGKEKMKSGKPDFAKGSFYNNPIYDEPTTDKKLIKKYPANYSKNIWPSEDVPDMEYEFKKLGGFMYQVGINILKNCDKFLKKKIGDEYPDYNLTNIIKGSKTYKARLLHYYELPQNRNTELDAACGWHLDHGGLTILTKALYLDENFNEVSEPNDAGLYIKDRNGKIHHGVIPENALLCQVGEILQILSGGYLQATPHAVRSSKLKGVTRETFPVFIDCNVEQNINLPKWSRVDAIETKGMYDLPGVPILKERYIPTKTTKYHEFVSYTLKKYYD
jgi:isopenicillin N synthase-like dioxygenase